MKKLIITERQYKMLEDTIQYTGKESDVKHFYSEIDNGNIDFDTQNDNIDVSDNTKLAVDWSVQFLFSEQGFKTNLKINKVVGKIQLVDWSSKEIVGDYSVDSSKNFKLEVGEYLVDNGEANASAFYLEFDFKNKIVRIK